MLLKKIYKKMIPARSGIQFFLWKYRHVLYRSWATNQITENNLNHPHRKTLLDLMNGSRPFNSVLEIGCASGINIFLAARKFPDACFFGLDINKKAIIYAKDFFRRENIGNVNFTCGSLKNLKGFSDKEFDIVLSDAVLIYVDNMLIGPLAKELSRITRKTLILVEFDSEETGGSGFVDNKCWVRDYGKLFEPYAQSIRKFPVEANTWVGNWEKYGKFVVVNFE